MLIFSAQLWNYLSKFICALSIIAIIIGAVFGLNERAFVKKAAVSEAIIVDLIERESNSRQAIYSAVFSFKDENGEEFTIHSKSASWPPVGEIGDKIEVLYDPEDPNDAMENQFFSKWGRSVLIGGIGTFYLLIFSIVAYLSGRRLENRNG